MRSDQLKENDTPSSLNVSSIFGRRRRMRVFGVRSIVGAGFLSAVLMIAHFAHADDGNRVNINTASEEELQSLNGIGPKLASEIIKDREAFGAFATKDDLARVPGISSKLLEKIYDNIETGGGEGALSVTEGQPIGKEVVDQLLRRFAGEPTIQEVQDQAVRYARSNPSIADSWRTRVRTNALLPQFRVKVDTDFDRDVRTRIDGDADDATVRTLDNDNTLQLEFRAQWELNRLVFDRDELGVWRETMRMSTLRDRVVDEVTRRFYERRRLQLDLELTPPTTVNDRIRKDLRIQELTSDIDALTGGWFSGEVERSQRPSRAQRKGR